MHGRGVDIRAVTYQFLRHRKIPEVRSERQCGLTLYVFLGVDGSARSEKSWYSRLRVDDRNHQRRYPERVRSVHAGARGSERVGLGDVPDSERMRGGTLGSVSM